MSLVALRSVVVADIAATRVIVIAVVIDSDVALSESCAII